MRLRWFAPVFVVLSAGLLAQTPGQSLSLDRVLDEYERADPAHPVALAQLNPFAEDGRLLVSLQSDGSAWIQAAGPKRVDERRLTVAALVLELAAWQREHIGRVSVEPIEWACAQLLQTRKPLPAERAWHIATVNLLQTSGSRMALATHLAHARLRFKDDPRLLMADAWLQRSAISVAPGSDAAFVGGGSLAMTPGSAGNPASTAPNMPGYNGFTAGQQVNRGISEFDPTKTGVPYTVPEGRPAPPSVPALGAIPSVGPLPPESPRQRALWQARDDYDHAAHDKSLTAEIEIRLGDLNLSERKPKDAVEHFKKALAHTADASFVHLAQFFMGQAAEQQQRWSDAESAYRAAIAAAPGGEMAARALISLLVKQGQYDAAKSVAGQLDRTHADPWTTYLRGDFVSIEPLIETLRAARAAATAPRR